MIVLSSTFFFVHILKSSLNRLHINMKNKTESTFNSQNIMSSDEAPSEYIGKAIEILLIVLNLLDNSYILNEDN